MGEESSPKKLQRNQKYSEALQTYKDRYKETLKEGDQFLSSLYADEIVQTVLLQRGGHVVESTLREIMRETMAYLDEEIELKGREEVLDDVEVAVRKRFPERFGIDKK